MEEAQQSLDEAQSFLDTVESTWGQVSEWASGITAGNETLGGIIAAVVGLAIITGIGYVISQLFNN